MSSYLASIAPEDVILPTSGSIGGVHTALLVVVLDGSDEYAEKYKERAPAKEEIHRELCQECVEALNGEWFPAYSKKFQDAAFASFQGADATQRAIASALSITRSLTLWNLEHQLSWPDQVHSRLAISSTWSDATALLRQATREQLVVQASLWKDLSEKEQLLLSGLDIRVGSAKATWESVNKQIENGVVIEEGSFVGRRLATIEARYDQLFPTHADSKTKRA